MAKLNSNYKKILIIVIPISVLFIGYLIYYQSRNAKEDVNENMQAGLELPVTGMEDVPDNKTEMYKKLEDLKKQQKNSKNSELSNEDFFNVKNKEEEKDELVNRLLSSQNTDEEETERDQYDIYSEVEEKDPPKTDNRTKSYPPPAKKKKNVEEKPVYETRYDNEEEKVEEEVKEEKTVDKKTSNYGFGVYQAKGKTRNEGTKTNIYAAAFLEENTKVKEGSSVIFILKKDIEIDGVLFKKMAVLYGRANFADTYVEVTISTIKNTDNKKYPVNLTGYNESYGRGITYEGGINEKSREGQEDLVDDVSNEVPYGGITSRTARNVAEKFEKPPEVNLSKGYRMYFKVQ